VVRIYKKENHQVEKLFQRGGKRTGNTQIENFKGEEKRRRCIKTKGTNLGGAAQSRLLELTKPMRTD